MKTLERQLADYGEQRAEGRSPLTAGELLAMNPFDASSKVPMKGGWMVAAAVAAVILVVFGGFALLLDGGTGEVVDSPDLTQTPDPTAVLPTVQLDAVPPFEALVRYTLDSKEGVSPGFTVDVLISYDPPDSFRRDIVAYDPEEMSVRFGKAGNYVATDGSFPIFTGETTEEGEELGPLVWSNWENACVQTPEATAVVVDAGIMLTVVECEAGDSQWVAAGTPWTIRVDPATGVVFDVVAELAGGVFRIPGSRMEILSIDYGPEFVAGYFATPTPDPSAIPGDPFAFTYMTDDGREVAVSWLDHNTWRRDYIVGGGSGLGSGSYQIYADGTLYTYITDTNEYREERVFAFDGRAGLTEWKCDQSGTCEYFEETDTNFVLTCQVSDGGTILGRPVTRYDCEPTTWVNERIFWTDHETGYILKTANEVSSEVLFEVLTINLAPSFDPALFEQKCPNADCTEVDTG